MHRGTKSVTLIAGLALLGLIFAAVFGASLLAPYDPVAQNAIDRLQGPSWEHPLGTDRFGRDMLSRALYGGQHTLLSSLIALGATIAIGLLIGIAAGMYHGSFLDTMLMRLIDVLLAFPFMVLAIVIAALFGTSLIHLLAAVVTVCWVPFARVARSVVLQARSETSYAAAQILGASRWTLMFRELLPKTLGPVLVLAAFELGSLILSIAALSFLGLGAQPPAPEWGSMLADGRDHFFRHPHILLGPALFIFVTVAAFNWIGEGLRDRLDPYEGAER